MDVNVQNFLGHTVHAVAYNYYYDGKIMTKEERQSEQNALEGHKNNAHKCYLSPILALLFEV